jgi:hypothetical protein
LPIAAVIEIEFLADSFACKKMIYTVRRDIGDDR